MVPQLVPEASTPTPEQRVGTIRSLLGHRKPSEHLLKLIVLAAQGADWAVLHKADAEAGVRR